MVEQAKKLKVLCLHGYNSTAEIFDYQLKHFKKQYGQVMDFHILNSPHFVEGDRIP
jgi:hypothetical protein